MQLLVDPECYSPYPEIDKLSEAFFEDRMKLPIDVLSQFIKIDYSKPENRQFIDLQRTYCKPYINREALLNNQYYYPKNGMFGLTSAILYHSIILRFIPNRIIEIGSGFSTLLASEILGRTFKLSTIDIDITKFRDIFKKLNIDFIEVRIQDWNTLWIIDSLRENDILFIDTTHVIKAGGDVNYIFFNILPKLKKGVLVHIHDIFLPYEYPREWIVDKKRAWNEQYFLAAFLHNNEDWKIIWAENDCRLRQPEIFNDIFKDATAFEDNYYSSSLWLQKIK